MKKCPYCSELIQEEASLCRYCGRVVDADRYPDPLIRCPYCGELINADAAKCRFCANEIPGSLQQSPHTQLESHLLIPSDDDAALESTPYVRKARSNKAVIILAVIFGLVVALFVAIPSIEPWMAWLDSVARGSSSVSQLRSFEGNLIGHFITNWVIWSLIAGVVIGLFRKYL